MIRAAWSWRALTPVCAAFLAVMGAAGCGTSDEEEDCFQIGGSLAQVTSDTLTVDHFDAVLSPSGTLVLFTSDHWVEEFEDVKESGERDIGLIGVPEPGEVRTPVPTVHLNDDARRVVIEDLSTDDRADVFSVIDKNKGELAWTPDPAERLFFAVIQNADRRDRIYQLRLADVAPEGETTIDAFEEFMVDDVGLASAPSDRQQYFYRAPAVSPDGRWLVYTRYFFLEGNEASGIEEVAEKPALFAYDLQSDPTAPVTFRVSAGNTIETDASWSPDGQWIAFTSNSGRVGTEEIYKIRFDPDNPAVEGEEDGRIRLTFTTGSNDLKLPVESFDPFWMRNNRIVFTSTRRPPCSSERLRNIWSVDANGGDLKLVVQSDEDDHFPGGANFDTNASNANGVMVFSSRRNPVEDFKGQKNDLYLLRGGF